MNNNLIKIWDNAKFQYDNKDGYNPTIETYILNGDKKRGAVVICPGGAYGGTSEREAEGVALQFNAAGFHAFVLYYSVAPKKHPQPLLDLAQTMNLIRKNAEEWRIDADKIAVCGFSAGGHLAASLGVHWDKQYLKNALEVENDMFYPNALILSYPVITSGKLAHRGSFDNLLGDAPNEELLFEMSLEHHITEKTPKTFIWHTYNDETVPVENSMLFAMGLRKKNIPFELHVYHDGPHGLSLATKETDSANPHVATWVKSCIEWLEEVFK